MKTTHLWKLHANHTQHIFSMLREEHCSLYSYSRRKKLGIDFSLGSAVKQNLDPKLLTDGIMVITVILEYNHPLNENALWTPWLEVHAKTTFCFKCYQNINHKFHRDESDPGHMHHPHQNAITDSVSASANCSQKVKDAEQVDPNTGGRRC